MYGTFTDPGIFSFLNSSGERRSINLTVLSSFTINLATWSAVYDTSDAKISDNNFFGLTMNDLFAVSGNNARRDPTRSRMAVIFLRVSIFFHISFVISGLAYLFSANSAIQNISPAAAISNSVNSPGEIPNDSLIFTAPL